MVASANVVGGNPADVQQAGLPTSTGVGDVVEATIIVSLPQRVRHTCMTAQIYFSDGRYLHIVPLPDPTTKQGDEHLGSPSNESWLTWWAVRWPLIFRRICVRRYTPRQGFLRKRPSSLFGIPLEYCHLGRPQQPTTTPPAARRIDCRGASYTELAGEERVLIQVSNRRKGEPPPSAECAPLQPGIRHPGEIIAVYLFPPRNGLTTIINGLKACGAEPAKPSTSNVPSVQRPVIDGCITPPDSLHEPSEVEHQPTGNCPSLEFQYVSSSDSLATIHVPSNACSLEFPEREGFSHPQDHEIQAPCRICPSNESSSVCLIPSQPLSPTSSRHDVLQGEKPRSILPARLPALPRSVGDDNKDAQRMLTHDGAVSRVSQSAPTTGVPGIGGDLIEDQIPEHCQLIPAAFAPAGMGIGAVSFLCKQQSGIFASALKRPCSEVSRDSGFSYSSFCNKTATTVGGLTKFERMVQGRARETRTAYAPTVGGILTRERRCESLLSQSVVSGGGRRLHSEARSDCSVEGLGLERRSAVELMNKVWKPLGCAAQELLVSEWEKRERIERNEVFQDAFRQQLANRLVIEKPINEDEVD